MKIKLESTTKNGADIYIEYTSTDILVYSLVTTPEFNEKTGERNKSAGKLKRDVLGYYSSTKQVLQRVYDFRLSEFDAVIDDLELFRGISDGILKRLEAVAVQIERSR